MDYLVSHVKRINVYLPLIILLAFALRAYNLHYNSAFLDEAIYILRGLDIFKGNIDEVIGDTSWIGGFPFFYPFVSAAFYEIGGITASRFFSVMSGTLSVYLMYVFTRDFKFFQSVRENMIAGLVAASFLATSAVAISTSRMAIYDSLSFTLFLIGLVTLHKAIYTGEKKWYSITAGALFLSFLAKYVVAMFFPFLLLLPIQLAILMKHKESIRGILNNFWLPLLSLTGVYLLLNFSDLVDFFQGQTAGTGGSAMDVIRIFWEYSSVAFLLAAAGTFVLWKQRKILIGILLFFAFLPIIIHALTGNSFSAQQHTYLTLIFLFPIVGAFFSQLITKYKNTGIAAAIAVIAISYFFSLPQAKQMERFWPNSDAAIALLKERVTPEDVVLTEGDDIAILGLYGILPADKIAGPFYFEYETLTDTPAYVKAVEDRYFRFIQLEDSYFSDETLQAIEDKLPGKYEKIYDDGKIRMYEKIV